MPNPHVIIIAQYFPPDVAGTSTRAYNAAVGLRNQGCAVTVITAFPHYPDGKIPSVFKKKLYHRERLDGINVIRTWVPPISHYTIKKRLLLHASFIISSLLALLVLRRKKVDVIVAMNPSLFSFFPSLVFKFFYRSKMIRNIDDLWPEVWYEIGIIRSQFIKRMLNWVAKLSYDVPYAITPISNTYVDVLTQKYGIRGEKIFVIEHGVDITRFHRDTFNDRGGTPASTLIVYSGALSIGYDFEPIVKAAKLLENEPIKFILRGSGTSANDIENIKSIIHNSKTRNVELRTERLSSKDLVKFLHRADIFVLPMSFAGFDMGLPTKLLEYQALGKPVICISNGEAADYVSSTRSGLVNRTKDPQEIAALIRKLADDKNLAKELGENGYKYVLNNLTIENIGKRFMEIVAARNNSVGIVLDH